MNKLVRNISFFVLTFALACGVCFYSYAQDIFSYSVKGIIKGLPGEGRAINEILVKHEPIADFRNKDGEVVGMMAMTMPFYLAEGVVVSDLRVGDSVEMVVEQRIRPRYSDRVVKIEKIAVKSP